MVTNHFAGFSRLNAIVSPKANAVHLTVTQLTPGIKKYIATSRMGRPGHVPVATLPVGISRTQSARQHCHR